MPAAAEDDEMAKAIGDADGRDAVCGGELYDPRDYDERAALYQRRSTNDPERVAVGTSQRKLLVDQYLQEELDEEEGSIWWGRYD
jgi:hypothetical protein